MRYSQSRRPLRPHVRDTDFWDREKELIPKKVKIGFGILWALVVLFYIALGLGFLWLLYEGIMWIRQH